MVGTEFQGKGYGKEVLDFIVKKCKNENRSTVMYHVH